MSIPKYQLPSVKWHAVFDSWCTLTLTFDSCPKQFRLLQITNSCTTELYFLCSYFYMQRVLSPPKPRARQLWIFNSVLFVYIPRFCSNNSMATFFLLKHLLCMDRLWFCSKLSMAASPCMYPHIPDIGSWNVQEHKGIPRIRRKQDS